MRQHEYTTSKIINNKKNKETKLFYFNLTSIFTHKDAHQIVTVAPIFISKRSNFRFSSQTEVFASEVIRWI